MTVLPAMLPRGIVRRFATSTTRGTRDIFHPALASRSRLSTLSSLALKQKPASYTSSGVRSFATEASTSAAGKKKPATKKTGTKKAAAKKPKKAKKPIKKKKPAPKKKVLTEVQKTRLTARNQLQKRKELRETALLKGGPTPKPDQTWRVYVAENVKKNASGASQTPQIAASYRNLSVEQRERLNHTANQNKAANAEALTKWIRSFTPAQIHEANLARKQLNTLAAAASKTASSSGKAPTSRSKRYQPLRDDRQVKQKRGAYAFFTRERHESGDFKGISIPEASKRIATEFKNLGPQGLRKYEELAAQDKSRYLREYKATYGKPSPLEKRESRSPTPA